MNFKQFSYLVIVFLIGLFFGFAFNGDESETIDTETEQEIADYQVTIEDLNIQISNLEKEISESEDTAQQEVVVVEEIEEPKLVKSSINLLNWNRDEIVTAMAVLNPDFEQGTWFTYLYREDGRYYDQIGPIFDEDPFSKLTYTQKGDEFTKNALRVFILNTDKTKAQNDYDMFVDDLIKETQLDKDLVCSQEDGCAGIKIIKCNKFGQLYSSWFEGNYLFTSRNDNGATLDTFQTFYCQ